MCVCFSVEMGLVLTFAIRRLKIYTEYFVCVQTHLVFAD